MGPRGRDPGRVTASRTRSSRSRGSWSSNALYDTLTTLNDKGQYVPYLAQSVTPNTTFDQWTIKLRPDVTFQDGEPLDAAALKLNLDSYRGANPRIQAPLNSFVLANIADVDGGRSVDGRRDDQGAVARLPAYLWQGGRTGIAAPAQLNDPSNCARNMIGTGPFKLQEWRPNEHLVAVRNPNYWRKGLPYLDKITFVRSPTGRPASTTSRAGRSTSCTRPARRRRCASVTSRSRGRSTRPSRRRARRSPT